MRAGSIRLLDHQLPRPIFSQLVLGEQLGDDPRGLLRALGYPASELPEREQALSQELADAVGMGQRVLEPKGMFAVFPLEMPPDETRGLVLGDTIVRGEAASFLAPANQLAVFCVTVGSRISELSRQAMREGDPVRAWALDAVGSWGAERMAELVHARIITLGTDSEENRACPSDGCGPGRLRALLGSQDRVSVRYSPGYCGLELEAQRAVFSLLDTAQIGVTLTDFCLMQPEKSVSGLVGLGPPGCFPQGGCPCRRCPLTSCAMRRA